MLAGGKLTELKQRLLFVLGALLVYRIGTHIPVPGIDPVALSLLFEQQRGSILDMFNMFSGGALERFSVLALGIMPYISASIIVQLLTKVHPKLEQLSKEGASGRRKISQYTRYGTLVLATFQAFGIATMLESQQTGGMQLVIDPGLQFRIATAITLVTGTMFLMWLGEQVTERGIGNGISLIIFAGIIARMPNAVSNTFRLMKTGEINIFLVLVLVVLMVTVVGFIIFVERGQRRIPVQYAKRIIGRKMYGGQSTHLPLKVNTSGVIPPIFASSIIMFPATIANFIDVPWVQGIAQAMTPGSIIYNLIYVGFIIFFCFFYTAITFNPVDVAENMKKHGGYIPGIRPGKRTADYIDRVLTRVTFSGALYVSAVCVLPTILIARFNVPFYFGGTALLIVVGVAIDTVSQMEGHMLARHYEGFMGKGGPFKGRR